MRMPVLSQGNRTPPRPSVCGCGRAVRAGAPPLGWSTPPRGGAEHAWAVGLFLILLALWTLWK